MPDGTQVFVGSAAPHVLLVGALQVLFAGRSRVLLLVGVRQVAVRSVGGFLDLVLHVGIPVAVLRQQSREAVFDTVLHVVPDVALGLVADLVTADEAERRSSSISAGSAPSRHSKREKRSWTMTPEILPEP